MQIVIDIPDEQIEKSLAESKYMHENEGEKGSVNIVLLYTNKKLEFVDISRKTDFYSLTDKYTVLPKGHGRLMILSEDAVKRDLTPLSFSCQNWISELALSDDTVAIIEADNTESIELERQATDFLAEARACAESEE